MDVDTNAIEKKGPHIASLSITGFNFDGRTQSDNLCHVTNFVTFFRQCQYPSGFHCGAPKTTQQRFEHVTAENVPFKIPALSYRLTTGNRYYSNVGATDTLISSGFGQRGVLRPLASASRTLRVVLPGSRGGVTFGNKENNNERKE